MGARASVVRRRAARLGLVAAMLSTLATAQVPDDSQRTRFRDRYKQPENSQKLTDNLRKLNSDDPQQRLDAIRALGELNDAKATEYLVGAANDPDMRIRIKAIDTLGNAHAKEATGLLIQQLFLRGTDLPTKQRILAALGKIGDPRATGPILDILSRDIDPAVRGNAIFALGEIGDRAALSALESLAKAGPDDVLRRLAVEAARKIRDRPAPAVVPPALAVDHRPPENAAAR